MLRAKAQKQGEDCMKIRFGWLVFLTITVTVSFPPACSRKATQVQVEEGTLSGTFGNDSSIRVYKGVPFAAPPVGELRWQPPRPPEPWTGVRSADTFSPACSQESIGSLLPWTEEYMHQGETSEDCLYLNIWTCAESENDLLPVMVYIYGGGFTQGSNAVSIYNGESLARKGVVLVIMNYRVGPLGFLAHPELTRESDHRTSGNYGLLDQVAALWWVHNNISAFGGNPDNVTIFGQSAGAISVAMLMQSPLAEGLFNRAIIQSGPGLFSSNALSGGTSLEEAEEAGLQFAEAKGAVSLSELRAMPLEALLEVPQGTRFGPIQDNWFLPANYHAEKQVPVINGFTADDMEAGGGMESPIESTIAAYEKEAWQRYGKMTETFLSLYPAASDSSIPALRKNAGRDRARVSLYLWATEQAGASSTIYTYYFDRAIPWPEHPEYGAFHSGELPYMFNNLHLLDRPWEAIDRTIADQMSSYWTNFAKTGNPNGLDLPVWQPFNASEATTMQLGTRMGPLPIAAPEKFAFWKEVLSERGQK
jgi:para-nitrobenzyl esterase